MELLFLCPLWGSEQLPFTEFVANAKAAGYDGVEVAFPTDRKVCREWVAAIRDHDLCFVAQHWDTLTADYDKHGPVYLDRLSQLAETEPLFINSHSGRDHFSFIQNQALLASADGLSRRLGLPIYHETHRGRFNFAAHVTLQYLKALPDLKITADFSHWCCVAESLLADQPEALTLAIARSYHVHCRVGHSQGSQVTSLALPEYADALEQHLQWWAAITASARARGQKQLTFTSEFGPAPYMLNDPETGQPIADQWAMNVQVMQLVRERVQKIAE
ncbi:sugar phosphate isomerase/epimerase family protein [Simiduia agarivorans]|uniref:Xylose isomerase n=1 Tax=Simiduia agarivorans (strain DSM 21679 / JCM 13881 / BCRC 17597 / SA1) TaxID=1117647 RepID=K4L2L8_SIMAS|nr:sugar phosphate isomerase/epimerase [Simiduia agarivorans]AFV00443.1 xylose isomerase [Simiduia agarivorans SA1 = DSM 21679]